MSAVLQDLDGRRTTAPTGHALPPPLQIGLGLLARRGQRLCRLLERTTSLDTLRLSRSNRGLRLTDSPAKFIHRGGVRIVAVQPAQSGIQIGQPLRNRRF